VLRCHTLRAEGIGPFLADQFALPPTDRVADAFLDCKDPDAGAAALGAYDAFLALLDDDEARAELRALDSRNVAASSPRFRHVAELGAEIERGLLALLFGPELGPVTQRYAVL
jgi:hypothetical protein